MLEIPDPQLRSELGNEETLLWSGRPKQGILFRSSDVFFIPFSLLWGGFAIFWEAGVIYAMTRPGNNTPLPIAIVFLLFGIPFVLIGLYFIFGRFFVDAKRRENTYYGLTDNRIIIVEGIFSRQVKSVNLKSIPELSLTEKADGSGTINFGPSFPMTRRLPGSGWPGMQGMISCFEAIQNAKEVYEKIRTAQASS